MSKIFVALFVSLFAVTFASAQDTTEEKPPQRKTITISEAKPKPSAPLKTSEKRSPVFRPTKDQIKQAQAMLKGKALYNGEASGSYNTETRAAIRGFQKDNGLTSTGSLNRATLEKMGIELTEAQKAVPVSEGSIAASDDAKAADSKAETSSDAKPKRSPIFRANKEQIMQAQKLLKDGSMYSGEQTGKLDKATREGLKKYQEANGLKATGTLNQLTLEKMGIELTESQKSM